MLFSATQALGASLHNQNRTPRGRSHDVLTSFGARRPRFGGSARARKDKRMCEQAAIEQDSQKLMRLIQEISRLLDEKEDRLKQQAKARP